LLITLITIYSRSTTFLIIIIGITGGGAMRALFEGTPC